MIPFYDLHTHVLPDIDDGAKNIEETIDIVKNCVEKNILHLVATPHFEDIKQNHYQNIINVYNSTKSILQKKFPKFNLYLGAEISINNDVLYLIENDMMITINNSNYILIELPFFTVSKTINSILFNLLSYGYRIIIAHPERYDMLLNEKKNINDYKKNGILFQVNSGSFLGSFGTEIKKRADYLLNEGYINIISSDRHSEFIRGNSLVSSYNHLLENYNELYLKYLFSENPKSIIQNKNIKSEFYRINRIRKNQKRFWYWLKK